MLNIRSLPFELLEIVVSFMDDASVVSLSRVDSRVETIMEQKGWWWVTFPPRIDWSSPTAPKQYTEYDRTDFTIHYKGQLYTRGSGITFNTQYSKSLVLEAFIERVRADTYNDETTIILPLNKMILETKPSFAKCVVLGMSEYEIDKQVVINALYKWPKVSKPQVKRVPFRIPRTLSERIDDTVYREFDSIFPPPGPDDDDYE
jgi:hypothetical protein